MSTRTQARKLSMLDQWTGSRQLSMSTRTQARKLSMPDQWARSQSSINVNTDTSLLTIHARSMGTISSTNSFKRGSITLSP